ncbi:MAG TPA: hypothetical protein VMN03_05775, partial [Burkholderiales bacterium]|nr:hypothetical protein [Burkholderiales bacterium]
PLRGMSDIERRMIGLVEELYRGAAGGGASNGALVREALGIFATALLSLARIKGPTDPAMGRAGPRPVTAEQARMTG